MKRRAALDRARALWDVAASRTRVAAAGEARGHCGSVLKAVKRR